MQSRKKTMVKVKLQQCDYRKIITLGLSFGAFKSYLLMTIALLLPVKANRLKQVTLTMVKTLEDIRHEQTPMKVDFHLSLKAQMRTNRLTKAWRVPVNIWHIKTQNCNAFYSKSSSQTSPTTWSEPTTRKMRQR